MSTEKSRGTPESGYDSGVPGIFKSDTRTTTQLTTKQSTVMINNLTTNYTFVTHLPLGRNLKTSTSYSKASFDAVV